MIDVASEQLLSLPEAARMVKRHRDTLRAWIADGILEGIWLGGRLYTSVEAIQRAARPGGSPEERTSAERSAPRRLPLSPDAGIKGEEQAQRFLDDLGIK